MSPQSALAFHHETNNTILSSQSTGSINNFRRDQQAQSFKVGFAPLRPQHHTPDSQAPLSSRDDTPSPSPSLLAPLRPNNGTLQPLPQLPGASREKKPRTESATFSQIHRLAWWWSSSFFPLSIKHSARAPHRAPRGGAQGAL